jgi:hypothetical protein
MNLNKKLDIDKVKHLSVLLNKLSSRTNISLINLLIENGSLTSAQINSITDNTDYQTNIHHMQALRGLGIIKRGYMNHTPFYSVVEAVIEKFIKIIEELNK